MRFFDLWKQPDINLGLEEYDVMPEAVLLDVRTPQEYREGHVPCSKNVPLQRIEGVRNVAGHKDTPLFVYCYSGARSSEAAYALREMGYTRVRNIGGVCGYRGKLERGAGRGEGLYGGPCAAGG